MASLLELRAEGIGSVVRVAKQLGPDVSRDVRKVVRAAGAPIVKDARRRYRGAVPLGDRAARTVRQSVTQSGVQLRAGGFDWSKGAEFGSKRRETRRFDLNGRTVVRKIDYSSPRIFGAWTGNRATLRFVGGVSGRALYPAAAEGREEAVRRLEEVLGGALDRMARAGS